MLRLGPLVTGLLAAGLLAYAVVGPVPVGPTDLYMVLAGGSLLAAWILLARAAPERPWAWRWLLGGFSAWVAGDLLWAYEQDVLALELFPAWSDALYLLGYAMLVAGATAMVRTRRAGRDRTAALDAAILAAGVAVPAWAFLVVPAAMNSSLSMAGRVVASAYPVLDLFLLAMFARLLTTPGARTRAFWLLVSALGATLVADALWNAAVVLHGSDFDSRWLDLGWLAGYVLVAAATSSRSLHTVTEPPPHQAPVVATRRRLVALAVASTLPAATLAADGWQDGDAAWLSISVGSVVLSLLVLLRMAGLLEQVQVQAVQLAALARVDGLTGVPNRRTWDHELSRACAVSRDSHEPLAVALLDLDRFKRYNDRHGHQAGDRLLAEAAAAWTTALAPTGGLLARYGGEEFAVLLPGLGAADAVVALQELRAVTPGAQTFSAGVAVWDPTSDPSHALGAADAALYEAKRRGRDRVVVADVRTSGDALPAWASGVRVALQPIFDMPGLGLVGHEALARFHHDRDVTRVFTQAHEDGFGDLLEAHVIGLAMALPDRPAGSLLFVNVSAAALTSPRFWRALPEDLAGMVVELVEERLGTTGDHSAAADAAGVLRARGAVVAVDDLGAGNGDLGRLLAARPDIVKVDRGLVAGCGDDPGRLRLIEMVVGLSAAIGARVCAEGVESADDLDALRACGVHLVQGYYLGRPGDGWSGRPSVAPALAAVSPG